MDATTATSKAETAFYTNWRTARCGSRIRTIPTQRRGDCAYQFYAALHESAFGTKRTSAHCDPLEQVGCQRCRFGTPSRPSTLPLWHPCHAVCRQRRVSWRLSDIARPILMASRFSIAKRDQPTRRNCFCCTASRAQATCFVICSRCSPTDFLWSVPCAKR